MNMRRVILAVTACLFFFLIGMLLDWKGFIGNVSVGVIEITITVTIIDWLLQQQRRKRWQRVRARTPSVHNG